MQSRKAMKWIAPVILLTLVLAAFSPATGAAPSAQEPSAISCGDSATCNMGTPAVQVINNGTGEAIRGQSTTSGVGVRGIGRWGIGVRGTSNIGAGVAGKSVTWAGVQADSTSGHALRATSDSGYGVYAVSGSNAGVWAQGYALGSDLILAGNNSTFSDGVIGSDPDYPSSDFWIMSQDDVHIVLDTEDDETGQFDIYNELYAGQVILRVEENGELYIADDLHLDTDGGSGEIFATGASNSRLYLYSNSWAYVHLDDNNDEAQSCFSILDGTDSIIWQQCETKGTTSVGTQAVAVETSSGSRELYAIGSPGLWFEDFGSAALVDGQATVTIDPLFAETVNLDVDYQVYLTPVSSEAVLLFVTEKTPTAFTVQGVTLDGSPTSASFDYRIVAKRRNYENQRLEQVDLTSAAEPEP